MIELQSNQSTSTPKDDLLNSISTEPSINALMKILKCIQVFEGDVIYECEGSADSYGVRHQT